MICERKFGVFKPLPPCSGDTGQIYGAIPLRRTQIVIVGDCLLLFDTRQEAEECAIAEGLDPLDVEEVDLLTITPDMNPGSQEWAR